MKSALKSFSPRLSAAFNLVRRYYPLLFFVLLAVIYGFILIRINTFSNVTPTDSDIAGQLQTNPAPHLDPTTVERLQQLQDNSVSVQALFDEARNNPFQE